MSVCDLFSSYACFQFMSCTVVLVGTPAFAPTSGPVVDGRTISVTASSASYICYRLDGVLPLCGASTSCAAGSNPISGTSGTVTVTSAANQLIAVACDATFQASAPSSQTYTIGSLGRS
jgi:hypothetical protein